MICLDVESQVWRKAVKPTVEFHVIHDDLVSRLDRVLADAIPLAGNDRGVRGDLWALRLSILQTFLPLGSDEIGLESIITRVMESQELRPLRSEFESALESVRLAKGNQKSELLDSLYCETDEEIHLWNRSWNQPPLGWPSSIRDIFAEQYGERVRLIPGIRDLPDAGSQLVLFSPLQGGRFPLASAVKLLRPGRWKGVHVFRYGIAIESDRFTRGALSSPGGLQYWSVDLKVTESTIGSPRHSEASDNSPDMDSADGANHIDLPGLFGDVDSGASEPVGACLVGFSHGYCVAYANDHQVRLLNCDRRLQVLDLKEGDLIPVAIDAVDRQTLEDMATNRLGQDNVVSAKKRIGAWKQVVHTCLARHGEGVLHREFRKRVAARNSAWREDAWSAETPWAPRSKHDFAALIHATNELGFFQGENVEELIARGWQDVQMLRNAHRLAGRELVSQLEDELDRRLQEESGQWSAGDAVSLDDGGRKYLVCEVKLVRDAGQLHQGQLGRMVKWQE